MSLVNAGTRVEGTDKDGLTALHCAASRGHKECIQTLVGLCGSEVDVVDNNGSSPLFYAVTLGHVDCAELLLEYGADPNRQDRKGRRFAFSLLFIANNVDSPKIKLKLTLAFSQL